MTGDVHLYIYIEREREREREGVREGGREGEPHHTLHDAEPERWPAH